MRSASDSPSPGRWWLIIAVLALVWGIVVLIHPIPRTRIGPWSFTAKDPVRPLALALLTGGWFLFRQRHATARFEYLLQRLSPWVALLAAAIVAALGLTFGSTVAGGTDSYGYISQADLWLSGKLAIPVPVAADAPWPGALDSFTPLGYRAAPHGWTILPVMFPGLPLLMAAVKGVFGHCAIFVIAPVCGAILVMATYGLGHRLGRPIVGLAAALLVATSPSTLFMAMNPMADLPCGAACAVAIYAVLGDSRRGAAAAGLALAMAVLIRPNVVLLVVAFAVWTAWRDTTAGRWSAPRTARTSWFLAPALLGPVLLALINVTVYGSPLLTGYGKPDFHARYLLSNVAQHLSWIRISETFWVYAGLAVLVWPGALLWTTPIQRTTRRFFVGAIAAVWVVCLFVGQFTAWWYVRYLLPIWPIVMLGMAVPFAALYRRPSAVARISALVGLFVLGVARLDRVEALNPFRFGQDERKYTEVAKLVRTVTPPESVIVSGLHSGSLRYYASRMTLLAIIEPGSLDQAVAWLARQGRHPYLLLEDLEEEELRQRRGSSDAVARTRRVPLVTWRSGDRYINLYDLLEPTTTDRRPQVIDLDLARAAADWCLSPAPPPTFEQLR